MSISTNGQICYGILLEDEFEFPWDKEPYSGSIGDWYVYEVLGFKHTFQLYDEHGEYVEGIKVTPEILEKYWGPKAEFIDKNPKLPIALANVCSCGYPQYIIADKRTVINCVVGRPTEIFSENLIVPLGADAILNEFCDTYGIEHEDSPKWWMCSLLC